ncbi:hypothetical protein ACFSTE_03120 [Aquimarina hainanensis]|uniref:CHAT domain-containing protein n=1 Tax=Aquimarina hainanensis TaxID=1578017 RepID=A0ABW5N3Z8_9FLAO
MKIRATSSSSIQYIFIQKDFGVQGIIDFTQNASNNLFNSLSHFPRDLMQLHNQNLFFETSIIIKDINPALNLLTFTDEQLKLPINPINAYTKLLNLENRPVVYFIDLEADLKVVKKSILNSGQKVWNYTFCGKSDKQPEFFNKSHYFDNAIDLIETYGSNFKKIKSVLSQITEGSKGFKFKVNKEENDRKIYNFNPTIANYFTSTQINNEFWKLKYPKSVDTPKTNIRNKILLDSVIEIDNRHLKFIKERNSSHRLPILVLSFPFYNPTIYGLTKDNAKTKKEKIYSKVLHIEQSTDYLNYFEANSDEEKILAEIALRTILNPKLKLLDGIAFLQASFNFSPTMRFPIIGKSIYKELSFFNPKNNFFSTSKSRKNKLQSIIKFGTKLSELTIAKETKEYIANRDGQILVISDLPIELLCLDSVPISFTHDVCRIHESNYQGTLNNYSANNRIQYSVNEETLKNTLVILSADADKNDDHEFRASYETVKESSRRLNFKYEYCRTISEIASAVEKYKPEILVFDCHGNIDEEKKTSYLVINGERLYGDDIIKYKIFAPIVFLSCCNTNPNYGYIHKIQDAFFQAGALTVTGTFLPISIQRGTVYYLRLLNLLNVEFSRQVHSNWLSFISQIIRSSILHEAYLKTNIKLNREMTDEEKERLSYFLLQTHQFGKRKEIFLNLMNEGIKLSDELNITIEDTESEFLMYSHYGRPDLILLESKNSEEKPAGNTVYKT